MSAIVIMVLLLGSALASMPVSAEPTVIHVPQDYSTIQKAVDGSSPGDTIIVGPGEWFGAYVNKPVNIIGNGAIVVDGIVHQGDPTVTFKMGFYLGLDASGVSISNFAFTVELPILGRNISDVTIEHNVMIGAVQGVTCNTGKRWTIRHNSIQLTTNLPDYYQGIGIYIVSMLLYTPNPVASGSLVAFNKITGHFPNPRLYPPVGIMLESNVTEGIVTENEIVFNKIVITSENSEYWPIPPIAVGMLSLNPDVEHRLFNNEISFNDLRDSTIEILGYPSEYEIEFWQHNNISRNLGRNRSIDRAYD